MSASDLGMIALTMAACGFGAWHCAHDERHLGVQTVMGATLFAIALWWVPYSVLI